MVGHAEGRFGVPRVKVEFKSVNLCHKINNNLIVFINDWH